MENTLTRPKVAETIYLLTKDEIRNPLRVYRVFFQRYDNPYEYKNSFIIDDFFHVMGNALARGKHLSVSETYMRIVCSNLELLLAAAGLIYSCAMKGAIIPESRRVLEAISRLPPPLAKYPQLIFPVVFDKITLDGVKAALYELEFSSTEQLYSTKDWGNRTMFGLFVGHLNALVEASYVYIEGLRNLTLFQAAIGQ